MSDGALFARTETTLFRRVGGEVLLVRAGREEIDVLSGPASVIWDLLDRPRTAAALVATLEELYGSPAEMIEPDVDRLLADLEGRGWVSEIRGGI